MVAANPDLRILCLHGWRGTARDVLVQTSRWAAALGPTVELHALDAPALARGAFGWWEERFVGWADSREAVLAAQPFDGVLGFSQGAAMTGLLAAAQQVAGQPRRFRFAIMVSGFTSPFPEHEYLFAEPIDLPSMHVIGRADRIVAPRDSHALAGRFADPLVVEHPGGHVVPDSPEVLAALVEFVRTARG